MSSVHNEWTQQENKLFEMALAEVDPNSPDRFEKIASMVPGKTVNQVQIHYQMLVDDIEMIEAGDFPIPNYVEIIDDDDDSDIVPPQATKKRTKKEPAHPMSTRGIPWTDEEHRMFLIGLKNCGKGDWRSISRNYVKSRTPTQVASHAQKHYLRISSIKINSTAAGTSATGTRRQRHPRPSIHDIRNSPADDYHHQAPMQQPPPLIMNNNNAAKNNFRRPIAPIPYPSTEAFSSSSFSSTSSTARTNTTLRRTSSSNLIPNSNFNNIGSSRLGRNPQISNNNYGSSSSYSRPTFMMSSAAPPPQAVPRPSLLRGQHPMTAAAGTGGAFYGGYPHNTTNYSNNNYSGTGGTHMSMNYQQAPQIQSSPSYGYNTGPSSYGYNTGLRRDERSSGSGGVVFELGPTAAEPPAATAYRSSTGSGGVVFELGPTVTEPPPRATYRGNTGSGSGGVVFELGPTVAEPSAAAAPDISMDVDDNNTNIMNHPYNYDQPIYSPAYDDMYPGYM